MGRVEIATGTKVSTLRLSVTEESLLRTKTKKINIYTTLVYMIWDEV